MRKFKSVFSFALLSAITCFSFNVVKACVFIGGIEPACSAYWKSDAVFVGRIVEISRVKAERNEIFDKLLLHFALERAYRGVEGPKVEVTSITGTECDTKFQLKETWFVYARRNPRSSRLEVWARTKLLSRAEEDLLYMNSLSEAAHDSEIVGAVYDHPSTPWEGIKIRVTGDRFRVDTHTDGEGQFRIPAIKPGRYTIRATFPPRTAVTGFSQPSKVEEGKTRTVVEYQEEVKAGRCVYVQFLAFKPRNNTARR
jgi:hypothetical protein